MTKSTQSWSDTKLWELLRAIPADNTSAILALEQNMPEIEGILQSGGTSPKDFTLHDAGHSFRVAQRMAEIIPEDVIQKLSVYELTILLLAAYLHDIGMTPAYCRVSQHYEYLLTGQSGSLTAEDLQQFQQWLDDHGDGITPPLSKEAPKPEELQSAARLTAFYCRHRHNDWSEDWIRNKLPHNLLGSYVDAIDDLVTICRSHHQGYDDLASKRFDPKIVGAPATVVHLRYLSVVLRIADVLEFDPERTPEVILKHRDISPGSIIFWWKDHFISSKLENHRLTVSATPPTANIHRAVEETVGLPPIKRTPS